MMSKQTYLILYKYMLIGLAVSFVAAIVTIFFVFQGIEDCEVEYGNILEWGYQNVSGELDFDFDYFSEDGEFNDSNHKKYIKYRVNNTVNVIDMNESGDLEIIKEMFPVEDDYIITICEGKLEGISRRSKVNDVFFYKLAKII